eukprot:gene6911-8592_t
MYTKLLAHPSHSGSGVLSSLGFALLRFPVRSVPGAQGVTPTPANGRHTVRDAALQLSEQPHAPAAVCDVNQVLRRMVRIARTLVPPGVRIAERYAALEQPGAELPEFHQVVLHLILDAAQAVNGCGTIDVASRCVDGEPSFGLGLDGAVAGPRLRQSVSSPAPAPSNGAIFQAQAYRPHFEDRRARLVGDVINIVITERTSAGKNGASAGGKSGSINFK